MSKNISEILGRGEKINSKFLIFIIECTGVAKKSDELLANSELYEKQAKQLNQSLFLRQYGPIIAVVVLVFLLLYYRFFW